MASGILSTMFYLSIKFTFSLVSCNKIAYEKNDIMYLLAHTYSCVHLASYARGYGILVVEFSREGNKTRKFFG